MWIEQGLDHHNMRSTPYLHDSRVREGISAMLVLDRVAEEEHRLAMEGATMVNWLDVQLKKVRCALLVCTGKPSG
jgi:hypothetical protein